MEAQKWFIPFKREIGEARDPLSLISSSWVSSKPEENLIRGGKEDVLPLRTTRALPAYAEMQLEKEKLSLNWNWTEISKPTRVLQIRKQQSETEGKYWPIVKKQRWGSHQQCWNGRGLKTFFISALMLFLPYSSFPVNKSYFFLQKLTFFLISMLFLFYSIFITF